MPPHKSRAQSQEILKNNTFRKIKNRTRPDLSKYTPVL